MRLRPALASTCLVLAPIVPLANAASAEEKPARVITLTGSNATLGITDIGAAGPTPGDVRTLGLALTNPKGQPAGRAEVVQILTRQDGDIGTTIKTIVLNLPRGVITATGQTQFSNITDPKARPQDNTEQIAITGGTGVYRGASGQIEIVVLPDFASKWIISLDK